MLPHGVVGLSGGGGGVVAPAVLTTLAQVASGTGTAANGAATVSAAIAVGDLIVISGQGIGLTSTAFPPGFSAGVTTLDSGTTKSGIYYKVATGADVGTSVTGFSGTGIGAAALNEVYVFRGDVAIGAVTPASPVFEIVDGNPSAKNVTAGSGTPPLVVMACWRSSGTVNPRTMSPAKDGEINSATRSYLGYKIYNSSPADVSIDIDDEGNANEIGGCYLQCA